MTFYTLRSMKTGRYISNPFAVGHNKVFNGRDKSDCFTWYSIEAVTAEKLRHHCCLIEAF